MLSRRQRGISFVEVMVGTFVLSILGLGIAGMQGSVEKTIGTDTVRFDARLKATRALETLSRQMRSASLATMRTLPSGFESWQLVEEEVEMNNLQFQAMVFDGDDPDALPTLSGAFEITAEASADDPANGYDDDHDGVVDSSRLVLDQPDGPELDLLDNVSACAFELNDRTLEMRITVSLRAPNGVLITESATGSVEIRND
jgi:Prokaryotic N-terminal methylation motif